MRDGVTRKQFLKADAETQGDFTREEWFEKNQWLADNGEVAYRVDSVHQVGTSTGFFGVTLTLTYEDGSSSARETYFLYEDGEWRHRFGQEEDALFMPEASFEAFVAAQGGFPSPSASAPAGGNEEEAAVEEAVGGHY